MADHKKKRAVDPTKVTRNRPNKAITLPWSTWKEVEARAFSAQLPRSQQIAKDLELVQGLIRLVYEVPDMTIEAALQVLGYPLAKDRKGGRPKKGGAE